MTLLLIIGTVSLIALNAFLVAGEYALVRARRARLEKLKEEGDKRAELALEQLEEAGRRRLRGPHRRVAERRRVNADDPPC